MNALETAIYTRLTGDATLMALVTGVYAILAPDDAKFPLVVYQKLHSVDSYTLSRRIETNYSYQIKAINRGRSKSAIGSAMQCIDELLTLQPLAVTGYQVYVVRRTGDIPDYQELIGDTIYFHVGAEFTFELA